MDSKSFWVPRYRSNKEEEYERDDAIFESVGLVPLRAKYSLCFEESSNAPEETACEPTHSCNENLQRFLSVLTGWDLLAVFPATDVRPKSRAPSFSRKRRPADVLCFRKQQETRVAIRRKDTDERCRVKWTSAILVEVHVATELQELYFELMSKQTGRTLALATVTAAAGETAKGTNKAESWIVTVGSGSGELRGIIVSAIHLLVLGRHTIAISRSQCEHR